MVARPLRFLAAALVALLATPAAALARFGGSTGHFRGGGGGGGFGGGGFRGGGGGFGGGGFGRRGFHGPHFFFFPFGGGGGFFGFIIALILLVVVLRLAYRAYRAYQGSRGDGGGFGAPAFSVPSLETKQELHRAEETRRQAVLADVDDGYWDPELLEDRVRECFAAVQEAWRDRDPERARPYVSDALYNRIGLQLRGMAQQGRFNRLDDIRLDALNLVRVYNVTDDSQDRFVVHLKGEARDWIEDGRGDLVGGSPELEPFTEFWSFARHPQYGWVVDDVQQEAEGSYHLEAANLNRDEGPATYER